MLKMKTSCERCKAELNHESEATICSYECTFCEDCATEMQQICPNCNGELVVRPKRRIAPTPLSQQNLV